MKRLLMLVTGYLFLMTMNVNAQAEYKQFRVDLGLGLCTGKSEYGTFGRMLYLEPKYAVIPQLSTGLKYETNMVTRNLRAKNYMFVQYINSCQATADYYPKQSTFRPFVGAGLGIYLIGVDDEMTTRKIFGGNSQNNFGVMFRTGFDISHIRLMLAYNLAGKDKSTNNANFLSVSIGAYFGGGKK